MNFSRQNIGLGVAGLGLGAELLRINNDKRSHMKVVGIYEPDLKRSHQRYDVGKTAQELAKEFKVNFIADQYEDLLLHEDIHCVCIFSPCSCHFEQIKKALLSGKHVIVTKPMVVSIQEAREVVSLVEQTGLKLLVAQSMRWNSMFMAIHDLVVQGTIGDIFLAEAYYVHDLRKVYDVSPWRYQIPQDHIYGGVCHPADLLRWYVGEVDEVFAYGIHGKVENRYPKDKEDNFVISLKFHNGAIGRILGAFNLIHPPKLWHKKSFHGVGVGLYGTKASLFNDRIVYDYYGKSNPKEEIIQPKGNKFSHSDEILSFLRHFEDCILHDKKPLVDVRDGAKIIAICSACWDSIHSGLPVKVSKEFESPIFDSR